MPYQADDAFVELFSHVLIEIHQNMQNNRAIISADQTGKTATTGTVNHRTVV